MTEADIEQMIEQAKTEYDDMMREIYRLAEYNYKQMKSYQSTASIILFRLSNDEVNNLTCSERNGILRKVLQTDTTAIDAFGDFNTTSTIFRTNNGIESVVIANVFIKNKLLHNDDVVIMFDFNRDMLNNICIIKDAKLYCRETVSSLFEGTNGCIDSMQQILKNSGSDNSLDLLLVLFRLKKETQEQKDTYQMRYNNLTTTIRELEPLEIVEDDDTTSTIICGGCFDEKELADKINREVQLESEDVVLFLKFEGQKLVRITKIANREVNEDKELLKAFIDS